VERTTQLSVSLENVPGQLGRLCRVLAQAEVNVRGIAIIEGADISTIRLILSNPDAAKRALRNAGLAFVAQEVLVFPLPDEPGALESVAVQLGEAGINVQYLYGTGEGESGKATMVLRVADVDRAAQILGL
jgi:hypothetical protein